MKKHIRRILLIFSVTFLAYLCKAENTEVKESRISKTLLSTIEDYIADYTFINRDYFGKKSLEWFTENMETSIFQKSEEVKGEFEEVIPTVSDFPEGLIVEMEKLVYQSLDAEMDEYANTPPEENRTTRYLELTTQLGAKEFELDLTKMKRVFPQLNQYEEIDYRWEAYEMITGYKYVYNMFHVPLEGEENVYVCVVSYGGSNGACLVKTLKWDGEKFHDLASFDTQNEGWGKVIRYEEEYYYVFLQYNYNLKNYDGIRLHRLGESTEEETLLIKYLPYDYLWENMYDTTGNTALGERLQEYLNEIEEEITSFEYLEQGQQGAGIFIGEEKAVEIPEDSEESSGYPGDTWYPIDFTNSDRPVYLKKSSFEPSETRSRWHLRTFFYLRKEGMDITLLLEEIGTELETPDRNELVLVQLWFKELEGKVYSFGLYHVSDYNYLLNVTLIEGDQITRIRTDMLVPKRHFVVSEEVFYNR